MSQTTKCEYCHKEFEYFDIVNHECMMDRLELLNDLTDFLDKIGHTRTYQLNEEARDKIVENIINIREILKKEMT